MRTTIDGLHRLTPQDFLSLGLNQLAYIRPVRVNGAAAFAICAADGTQLALHDDESAARALALQNEMVPVTLQ